MAELFNLFSGGALENCAIFSLGIMPYISASIMMQLLTAVIPRLGRLAKEELKQPKAQVYQERYTSFRHGLNLQAKYIDATSQDDLAGATFAFVCVDKGSARKVIFDLSNRLVGNADPEYGTTEEAAGAATTELFATEVAPAVRREVQLARG